MWFHFISYQTHSIFRYEKAWKLPFARQSCEFGRVYFVVRRSFVSFSFIYLHPVLRWQQRELRRKTRQRYIFLIRRRLHIRFYNAVSLMRSEFFILSLSVSSQLLKPLSVVRLGQGLSPFRARRAPSSFFSGEKRRMSCQPTNDTFLSARKFVGGASLVGSDGRRRWTCAL